MNCAGCGRESGRYSKCIKCQLKEAREEGYALGYQTGFLAGEQAKAAAKGSAIDLPRWRQLVQLCHADKHGNSETANTVTAWLMTIKPEG
jgi:hypothetical protein